MKVVCTGRGALQAMNQSIILLPHVLSRNNNSRIAGRVIELLNLNLSVTRRDRRWRYCCMIGGKATTNKQRMDVENVVLLQERVLPFDR
jgi:hypothetical protein